MRQKYLKYIIGIFSFSLFCWGVLSFTQFHENISNSLEGIHYILFLKTRSSGFTGSSAIKRGDIVSIQGYEPNYVGKKPFAKRVLGLPGDLILKAKNTVAIVPKTRVSKTLIPKDPMSKAAVSMASESVTLPLLEKTSQGKPLTPLSAGFVPEGYVFVAGDNLNSFDSRYEEFGLVPMEKIWGKAVFTW
ncbi:MAG: signal peptidase I [Proteobacteria bacterium]|nr:signal peptidase I [Pseudomonadota bacterium]